MKSWTVRLLVLAALLLCVAASLFAQGDVSHPAGNAAVASKESAMAGQPAEARTEANLILPDLRQVTFVGGITGHKLLVFGLFVCVLGGVFGLVMYARLKNLPVHRSMLEISELIYETCK